MARLPRAPRGTAEESWWASAFKWSTAASGFTEALLPGTRVFGTPEEAQAAWVIMRRPVWSTDRTPYAP